MGEIFEEGEAQRLALARRQGLDGRPHGVAAMREPSLLIGAGTAVGQRVIAGAAGFGVDIHRIRRSR